jgi:hypothetical protein
MELMAKMVRQAPHLKAAEAHQLQHVRARARQDSLDVQVLDPQAGEQNRRAVQLLDGR